MRFSVYLIAIACFSCASGGSYDGFFRALVSDDGAQLREYVDRGFDPNARDPNGQPAIMRALMAEANHSALVLARLPGIDVNVRNKAGETPLMMAALKGQVEIGRILIARGAEVRSAGWTPLHYAAAGNSLPAARLMLQHGAEVDARAPNGRTALMLAAQYGSEDIVEAMLAAGADPAARDRNGTTAADLADLAGREKLTARLAALARSPAR